MRAADPSRTTADKTMSDEFRTRIVSLPFASFTLDERVYPAEIAGATAKVLGMPKADAAVERASRIDTTALSDAMDRLGIPGQCLGIKPLDHGMRLAGPRVYHPLRTIGQALRYCGRLHR